MSILRSKNYDRMRATTPRLLEALIHDRPVPPPDVIRAPARQGAPSKRDAARQRQRRKRDRDRQRQAEIEKALETQREIIAEHLAPAITRATIYDHAGRMLVGPRVAIVAGRAVRAYGHTPNDTTVMMKLTERQRAAITTLRRDWEEVGAGLGVGATDWMRAGGSGDGVGGRDAMLAQIGTRARLEGALAHLGAMAPMVARVVLDCIPLAIWAAQEGVGAVDARTRFGGSASRLAAFYWPAKPEPGRRMDILVIGPAREAYSTEVEEGA